jgi:hypothetical protein
VYENPEGIGIYIRGLNKKKQGTPKAAAKKAKDHGVSFVAIMACWQDEKNGKPRQLNSNGKDPALIQQYADAFLDAGIQPWLWGFPAAGREEQYIDRFAHVTEVCDNTIAGWIHDPELFYKWKRKSKAKADKTMRGQPEYTGKIVEPKGSPAYIKAGAHKLVRLSIDGINESMGLAITSYGMAPGHKNFPWNAFGGVGFGSPQLYSVGPKDIDRGIRAWRNHGWNTIIPSVPAFGKNSGAKMHDHLSNFVDGEENINGFIFWSWRQLQRDEWRVLARWSDWLCRGACALPK